MIFPSGGSKREQAIVSRILCCCSKGERIFKEDVTFRGVTCLIALERGDSRGIDQIPSIELEFSVHRIIFYVVGYYGKGASVTIKYGEEDILIR